MINRVDEILKFQYGKIDSKDKKIFFVPFDDDAESELIEKPSIQGYEIDLKKNSLKRSSDLTDITITNTGDALNDLHNLLNTISKLDTKLIKSIFLYESNFLEFNSIINGFKSTILKYENNNTNYISVHNPLIYEKIKYFISKSKNIPDLIISTGDMLILSDNIRRIRESKLIFEDYYKIYNSDPILEKDLYSIYKMFEEFDSMAYLCLYTTKFFNI